MHNLLDPSDQSAINTVRCALKPHQARKTISRRPALIVYRVKQEQDRLSLIIQPVAIELIIFHKSVREQLRLAVRQINNLWPFRHCQSRCITLSVIKRRIIAMLLVCATHIFSAVETTLAAFPILATELEARSSHRFECLIIDVNTFLSVGYQLRQPVKAVYERTVFWTALLLLGIAMRLIGILRFLYRVPAKQRRTVFALNRVSTNIVANFTDEQIINDECISVVTYYIIAIWLDSSALEPDRSAVCSYVI